MFENDKAATPFLPIHIFISYSHVDFDFVKNLIADVLRDKKKYDVWTDKEIKAGDLWWPTILHAIEKCEIFLFVLSPSSTRSEICEAELQEALRLQKPIIPILIRQPWLLPFRRRQVNVEKLHGTFAVFRNINYVDMTNGLSVVKAGDLLDAIDNASTNIPASSAPSNQIPTPKPQINQIKNNFWVVYLPLRKRWRIVIIIFLISIFGLLIAILSRPRCTITALTIIDSKGTVIDNSQEITSAPGNLFIVQPEVTTCSADPSNYNWTAETGYIVLGSEGNIIYRVPDAAQDTITLRVEDQEMKLTVKTGE